MKFRTTVLAAMAAAAASSALIHSTALAQPDPSLSEVPLPQLHSMVVACDLQSPMRQSQTSAPAFCAAAADEVRQRAFGGDRERLLAWWREARATERKGRESARPASPPAKPLSRATPEQLKSTYLQCSHMAMNMLLDSGTAANCSMVYEELKQRVFGGDFQRLFAWSRQQRQPDLTANKEAGPARSL